MMAGAEVIPFPGQLDLTAYQDQLERNAGDNAIAASATSSPYAVDWVERGVAWVEARPQGDVLTTDDLADDIGSAPASSCAAAVIRRCAAAGLIESTQRVTTSRRPGRRRGYVMLWQRTAR